MALRTAENKMAERFTILLHETETHWVFKQVRYNLPDSWFPIITTLEQGLATQGFKDKLVKYRRGQEWQVPKDRIELLKVIEAMRLIVDRLKEHGGAVVVHSALDARAKALKKQKAPKLVAAPKPKIAIVPEPESLVPKPRVSRRPKGLDATMFGLSKSQFVRLSKSKVIGYFNNRREEFIGNIWVLDDLTSAKWVSWVISSLEGGLGFDVAETILKDVTEVL